MGYIMPKKYLINSSEYIYSITGGIKGVHTIPKRISLKHSSYYCCVVRYTNMAMCEMGI